MNTINYTGSVTEKSDNLTVFSLMDSTGKGLMDLISESKQVLENRLYTIDLSPVLVVGSTTEYDISSFSTIIQKYIEYLQANEEQDASFRLAITRKPGISDSFYEKVGVELSMYADKITIKSSNNMMVLSCD